MVPHATPEVVALAEFLWDVLDGSGLSMDEVRARFTKKHFPARLPIPSVSTVYKRLRGDNLENAGQLVNAIVEVCTPPDQLPAVNDRAATLKSLVHAHRPVVHRTSLSDDCRDHLIQLTKAQQQIIALKDENFALKQGRGVGEPQSEQLARVTAELHRVETERRKLAAELAAVREELQAVPAPLVSPDAPDPELDRVERELRRLDPDGSRFGAVLRRSFDEVYDGERTGRFSPDQLSKTEKSYLATVVEVELRREFELERGDRLDFRIDGIEVDLRFSMMSSWSIPREVRSKLCLLISANEARGSFSAGLLRITSDVLNSGRNMDDKSTVSKTGRNSMRHLVRDGALPENLLLRMDPREVAEIFTERSAQQRVLGLFRRVRSHRIGRVALGTVAMQPDPLKRARDARRLLAPEGVLVLGRHQAQLCAALGLPVPGNGEFVSIRMALHRPQHGDAPSVELGGARWVIATPADPVTPLP